jgi:hypothetical protein
MSRTAPRRRREERTPYALLVATALAALGLGGIALLLWGTRGGAYILDLVAAYCF